jgi:hypothetical protein
LSLQTSVLLAKGLMQTLSIKLSSYQDILWNWMSSTASCFFLNSLHLLLLLKWAYIQRSAWYIIGWVPKH